MHVERLSEPSREGSRMNRGRAGFPFLLFDVPTPRARRCGLDAKRLLCFRLVAGRVVREHAVSRQSVGGATSTLCDNSQCPQFRDEPHRERPESRHYMKRRGLEDSDLASPEDCCETSDAVFVGSSLRYRGRCRRSAGNINHRGCDCQEIFLKGITRVRTDASKRC